MYLERKKIIKKPSPHSENKETTTLTYGNYSFFRIYAQLRGNKYKLNKIAVWEVWGGISLFTNLRTRPEAMYLFQQTKWLLDVGIKVLNLSISVKYIT